MSTLRSALQGALPPASESAPSTGPNPPLQATEPKAPVGVATLPIPLGSRWGSRLAELGVPVRADSGVAALIQRTAGLVRELEAGGRKREARELGQLRDDFRRHRERLAWEAVKARFEEFQFPEKTYRALKQEGADPERVLARLYTRRAEEWRGIAGATLRDHLLEK